MPRTSTLCLQLRALQLRVTPANRNRETKERPPYAMPVPNSATSVERKLLGRNNCAQWASASSSLLKVPNGTQWVIVTCGLPRDLQRRRGVGHPYVHVLLAFERAGFGGLRSSGSRG
ncbi:hypothetical protein MTO96_018645 [Rhipicephalus appendiculatus]